MNEVLGWNILLVASFAETFLNNEWKDRIKTVRGDDWYPAQVVIDLINEFEKIAGRQHVVTSGKGIYFTIKEQIEKMGIKTPKDAIESLVAAYQINHRGPEIGKWELISLANNHVIIKDDTMYPCSFGEGVIFGAIKAFGGKGVKINHTSCKERGDLHCINEASWI